MRLKRNNWTNEEIKDIILGLVPVDSDGNESSILREYSKGLKEAAYYFEHFSCKPDDYSALSYDTETKIIYHTGRKLPQ